MPPSTAATKAFKPGMMPMKVRICGYAMAYSTPAPPAKAAAIAKVKEMIDSTSIPINRAVGLS